MRPERPWIIKKIKCQSEIYTWSSLFIFLLGFVECTEKGFQMALCLTTTCVQQFNKAFKTLPDIQFTTKVDVKETWVSTADDKLDVYELLKIISIYLAGHQTWGMSCQTCTDRCRFFLNTFATDVSPAAYLSSLP